ncbi:MAG: hypothetical protein ACXW08_11460 [Solirubrobacteraceae bacterium]
MKRPSGAKPPGRFSTSGRGTPRSWGGHAHAQDAAQPQEQDVVEEAKKELHELEEGDPPEQLEDWPEGKAKYLTYGGPEGTAGYNEGPTRSSARPRSSTTRTGP